MTREEAKDFLIDISYKLGNMAVEYLTEKDGEKMREAIKALEQEKSETVTEFADRCRECGAKYGKLLKQEPCEDAISRQVAKRILEDRFMELQKRHDDKRYETNYCLNTILELPPVNSQPKTGHWNNIPKYKDIAWHCSECKHFTTMKHNYCPYCGAKMIKRLESEEAE